MIKKNKIPTLIGIIVLLAGLFAGIFLVDVRQVFKIGADPSAAPNDVRVSNLSDSSATITWTTDKETASFISWGLSVNTLNNIEKESENDIKYFTHSITLTGLEPGSTYHYKINSDGNIFDNNGLPWQFTTGPLLNSNSYTFLISGSVLTASGIPEERAIVYANIGGYSLSTLTSGTGNFVFQLSGVRTPDLNSYAQISPTQSLIEISVASKLGVNTSAQVFPQSAKPIPPIILGQVLDFRSLGPSAEYQLPDAFLSLPEDVTKESKFSLPDIIGTPTPTSVILESLREGEIITSTKPAFFGRGPGGTTLTTTIPPDTTQVFEIESDGTWTWSPEKDLDPGAHTITVSWTDTTGITRNIVRNFIIQAGEAPAFEATPSQTLSPTPTPTPSATATPTPVATLQPTASPSATATPPPVPITGVLTHTLLLSIMGIVVFSFSFFVWKMAED